MIKKPGAGKSVLSNFDNEWVDTLAVDLWEFEPHEEQPIRQILSGCSFRPNFGDIDAFIEILALHCGKQTEKIEERYFRSRATIRENRIKLKRMLSDLLERITGEVGIWDSDDLSRIEYGDLYLGLLEHFKNIGPLLVSSIDIIEKIEATDLKRPGRPSADEHNFVKELAELFLMWIDMPTTYEGGIFYQLVQELYKVTGMWDKDDPDGNKEPVVTRAVEEAIGKLKADLDSRNIKISPTKRRKKI
ncbi:MAG TPA: hypothetical protein PK528_12040 [Syntrophorhabdus sp.]|nr:hypothetical protein [Syntrophorhabdus sp.]